MKGFFALSGGESELKGAPEIVKLLPLGHVSTKKGDFEVDEESFKAMKAQMQQHGVDIVIDYEHQTLKDIQAPAGRPDGRARRRAGRQKGPAADQRGDAEDLQNARRQ